MRNERRRTNLASRFFSIPFYHKPPAAAAFISRCLSQQITILYYIHYPCVFHGRILNVGDIRQVTHDMWHMKHDTWHMMPVLVLISHMSRDSVSSVCKISRSIKIYNSFWPGPHNLSSYWSGSLSLTITFLSQIPTPVPVMVCDRKI